MIKHLFVWWKVIAIIALFFILISFVLEFLVHLNEEQIFLLEMLDLVAIVILAIDLIIHYIETKEKKHFFRKNWLLVVSLFPLAQFLRVFKLIAVAGKILAGWLSKIFHLLTHSTKFMRVYRVFAVWFSKRTKKPLKKALKKKT